MNLSTRRCGTEGESGRRPRVALISHIYLEKQYRAKLQYLSRSVDLRVISPDQFQFPYGLYRADFSTERGYGAQLYPCLFPVGIRTSTRWILGSLDLGFRSFQPDIIHVENEAHSFSLVQALIYRWLFAPEAKIVVFVWQNQRLNGVKGWSLNLLAQWMQSGIDFFIAGNTAGQDLLVQRGIASDRIAVFPVVGIDVDYYRPATPEERVTLRSELGIKADEFVIGYVGRFIVDKGISDLVQAFQLLQEQAKDRSVRLLCVGDGLLKEDLLDKPAVVVASPGGDGKVLPCYQIMDALVLPSRTMSHWKEQFGLVLVEAMACGVPVVGSNSGAIPEVIGDGGLVFTEGNVAELSTVLWNLYDSPSLRTELSQRGRERVSKYYSAERIGEQTYDVYRHLVSAVKPARRKSVPESKKGKRVEWL